jgi:hypothetical protein
MSLLLADIVVKVLKCVRLFFPPNDKTSRNRRLILGSSPSPKSLVSSSLDDVTPYMFIRMSRLQPENLLIDDAKRLLQQYGPSRHAVLKRLSVASGAKRTWPDLLLVCPGRE